MGGRGRNNSAKTGGKKQTALGKRSQNSIEDEDDDDVPPVDYRAFKKNNTSDNNKEVENYNYTGSIAQVKPSAVLSQQHYALQQNPFRNIAAAGGAVPNVNPRQQQQERQQVPMIEWAQEKHIEENRTGVVSDKTPDTSHGGRAGGVANLQGEMTEASQAQIHQTPAAASAARSGTSSSLSSNTAPQNYVNWVIDQGGTTTFENDKRSVQRYVRETLFSDIKFLVEDNELDYTGTFQN